MDLATILGLILSVAFLIGAFVIEAMDLAPPPTFFGLIQATAAMIVFGGTTAALLGSYPLEVVITTLSKAMLKGFLFKDEHDGAHVVETFVRLSEKARREGLLSLEEEESALGEAFLKKGIGLVVDGQDPELIRAVLEIEVAQMGARHEESAKLLEKAGAFAPTI
jgi:chemotaxis protein MotA